jgi:hypothetical protein
VRKDEDQNVPKDSYNQYEQHAAARRGQQEDEDVFTELIPSNGIAAKAALR